MALACFQPVALAHSRVVIGYDEASGGDGAIGILTHANVSGIFGDNTLAYQYDAYGRVTQKSQQLAANAALVTQTHYNAKGQKDAVTLPSGAVIGYSYGADGRTLTITVNGIVIVRDVEYFPFGDVARWIEANGSGTAYIRNYDSDGRIANFSDGDASRELTYDAASRITAQTDVSGSISADWTYGYDAQDRLTSASNAATTGATANTNQGFAYDATGNRSSATT
ncbi:MAG: hypothetical protein L0H70_07725, partial [Xanthomonadales bacterium]|nr:hypothetical protein [Xanthomonadales bacterium]